MSTTTLSAPLNIAVSVNRQAPAPEGARRLSALLLAAVLATLVVIADQVIDTWADGHLMLAWVILWALVFAGLALFADGARRLARQRCPHRLGPAPHAPRLGRRHARDVDARRGGGAGATRGLSAQGRAL